MSGRMRSVPYGNPIARVAIQPLDLMSDCTLACRRYMARILREDTILVAGLRRSPLLAPRGQFLRRDIELDETLGPVKGNRIAVFHQRDRAADERLGRDVPDKPTPRASREPAVGDQRNRIEQSLPDQRGGGREHLRHAGAALRALVTDDDDVTGLDLLREDRVQAVLLGVKNPRPAGELRFLNPGGLSDTAFGRQIAFKNGEMTTIVHRPIPRPDYLLIIPRLRGHICQLLSQGSAGDGNALAVKSVMLEQYLHELRNAAAAVKIHRDKPA